MISIEVMETAPATSLSARALPTTIRDGCFVGQAKESTPESVPTRFERI
jgi:hypothetical protein